ncbi:hypothetical protein FA09DRAFT_171229 [Tilletiopsis washingtonensis]|uniref:F-box domain-containing protein n=1 Tax=Tilletiopsis washingtonensis TaxID=58919 RepID=A0A316Z379_9BASI|nr:hypothetical protein FA09DRAFT_171229 [Tilletiopsis washingtonensis]PWN94643.1 hypothetical protein FA09DRAFT_171229 [Tilletiopsis washingtonensis]
MFPLLELPVELQIEVLRYFNTLELRAMKGTCRTMKNHVDNNSVFDGVMFRTKKVDMAALIHRTLCEEKGRADWTSYCADSNRKRRGEVPLRDWSDMEACSFMNPLEPLDIKKHPLIGVYCTYGESFQKIRAYSGEDHEMCCEKRTHSRCARDPDDMPLLHLLTAWRENATDPPTTTPTPTFCKSRTRRSSRSMTGSTRATWRSSTRTTHLSQSRSIGWYAARAACAAASHC